MKAKRKMLSGILLMLLAGMIAACGGQENIEESGKLSVDEYEKYGYHSPVTVKVGLSYAVDLKWAGNETPENNAWMDLYHENNIFPEIMYVVDETQAEARLSAAVMSGDYPDILSGDLQDYRNWVDNGVIADITDAYERYASDELKKYFESDGGSGLELLKIDGRLYGLPRIESPYEQIPIMFIRQDWLDTLGLEIPHTMDELKEVAHAFTYDDPDGNGIDDTYGIAIDGIDIVNNTVGDCSAIFAAYGVYLGNDMMAFVADEEGLPVWGGENVDGMKAALLLLKDLYEDGAICKDAVTMDSNAVFEDAGKGKCGIWFGPLWGGMVPASEAVKTDKNARISAASIPETTLGEVKVYLPPTVRSVNCVSSQCENPEILIKLMNLSVQKVSYPETEEEYRKYLGDNKNYTGSKTALIYLQDTQNYESYQKLKKALETGDMGELNLPQRMDMDKMTAYLKAEEEERLNFQDSQQSLGISYYTVYGGENCAWVVIEKMMKKELFIYPVNNGFDLDIMAGKADFLKQMTVEMIVKVMTGEEDAEKYEEFLEMWYTMGGKEILEEINVSR